MLWFMVFSGMLKVSNGGKLVEGLETKLNELLVTKAPFQIPENARKWIAQYAWIFALVGLVLGVLAFFPLLAAVGFISTFGTAVGAGGYVAMAWVSLLVLLGYLVVLGIAIPKLKAMQPVGWNLVYYSTLFFFAYDVFNWLRYPNFGSSFGLIWNVAATVVALYVIFQVRSYFKGGKAKAAHPEKTKS